MPKKKCVDKKCGEILFRKRGGSEKNEIGGNFHGSRFNDIEVCDIKTFWVFGREKFHPTIFFNYPPILYHFHARIFFQHNLVNFYVSKEEYDDDN